MKTECQCSHLTNFGLIFDISGALADWDADQLRILSYLSTVLLSLSCIAAVTTAAILHFSRLDITIASSSTLSLTLSRLPSSPRVTIVKHRAMVMFAMFALLLLGLDPNLLSLPPALCTIVAAALHFLSLSLFTWTLVEGVQLYRSLQSNKLTDTDDRRYANLLRYVVGYGLPLVIMTATLLLSKVIDPTDSGDDSYIHSRSFLEPLAIDEYGDHAGYCWLKENSFIYCFAGPVAVILIINTIIFGKAVVAANIAKKRLNTSNTVKVFGQMKTWIILCFLLGQTWAFGFLIQEGTEGFAYVFIILNGSSGIFLFIHTILMNETILLEVKIFLGLHDKAELRLEHSSGRIMASKSFRHLERPKVERRRPLRESTSSEDLPPAPRPVRRAIRRQNRVGCKQDREVADHWPRYGRVCLYSYFFFGLQSFHWLQNTPQKKSAAQGRVMRCNEALFFFAAL